MVLAKCAETPGLWGRNKQSSSSNSSCSPAREGSMILIQAGRSCNLGSGFGEGAVQGRQWTPLSRAARQALPCLQHRAGTAPGLCRVVTQRPLALSRGRVGGKWGLQGGGKGPPLAGWTMPTWWGWLRSDATASIPMHPAVGSGREEGTVCLYILHCNLLGWKIALSAKEEN